MQEICGKSTGVRKILSSSTLNGLSPSIYMMGHGKIPSSPSPYRLQDLKKFWSLLLPQVLPVGEVPSKARCELSFSNCLLCIRLRTQKNSELSLRLWHLQKFLFFPSIYALGLEKFRAFPEALGLRKFRALLVPLIQDACEGKI